MEWYLKKIPKTMFGFWMTEEFPWVRYLTLETFRSYHPDWEMILYRTPKLQKYVQSRPFWSTDHESASDYTGKNYWDRVEGLGIKIVEMDVEKEMGVQFPLAYCTIYADTMRYIALQKHGGFYIDLDNLFFRSLESMPFNTPANMDFSVFILNPPYHHIVLGVPGATYYGKVLEAQKAVLSGDPSKILDTTGCTSRVRRNPEDKVKILPLILTEENFDANGPKNEWALCLNWHGSGTYGKYKAVTEDDYMESKHPLAACIRYCLHRDMGQPNGIGSFQWIARGE
jgi:hypothetical protein